MQRAVNSEIRLAVKKFTYKTYNTRLQSVHAGSRLGWFRGYAGPNWEFRIRGAHSARLVHFNNFKQAQFVLTAERLILQRLGPHIAFLVVCFV